MTDVYHGGIFSGIEITEAIRVQMEVQHRLQQQLEVSLVLSWIVSSVQPFADYLMLKTPHTA